MFIMDKNKKEQSAIVKFFKGIVIYFKDYIIFLQNGAYKMTTLISMCSYRVGFQTIILLGAFQSYRQLNQTMFEIAPMLVKGGVEY